MIGAAILCALIYLLFGTAGAAIYAIIVIALVALNMIRD